MSRVAAIDCGTNSIRLLVSDNGHEITRLNEIVRLGQDVDATGKLAPEAIERTRSALERYVDIMRFERVEKVRMVATSATRDAENREDFFSMTEELLGVRAEVISGEEEAALSFAGAIQDLSGAAEPYCVIDLGGGSTEFIVGNADGEILGAHSAQMGCVRITERIMRADPPTALEVEIAQDNVRAQLEDVVKHVPLAEAKTFVGVAGTFTTLSALVQGLERYEPRDIHGSTLLFDALKLTTDYLISSTAAQRASHPVIHPGRADVIAGGSIVVNETMELISQITGVDSFIISEKDILDGIVSDLIM